MQELVNMARSTGSGVKVSTNIDMTNTETKLDTIHSDLQNLDVGVDMTTTNSKLDILHVDNSSIESSFSNNSTQLSTVNSNLSVIHVDNSTVNSSIVSFSSGNSVALSTVNSNLTIENTSLSTISSKIDTAISDKAIVAVASFTRPDNATPYTIGDVAGTDAATNISFATGATGILITQATLKIKINAVPAGMSGFKLHLYKAAPTAIVDNAVFNVIAADIDNYIGYIQFDTPLDIGDNLFAQSASLNFPALPAVSTLYGVLQTDTAYTPSSQNVYSLSLRGVKCV
jgi:hypothetical protein